VNDKPVIRIGAEPLLQALQAALPFAAVDKEQAHLMVLHLVARAPDGSLRVEATDGVSCAMLDVPIHGATEDVDFCLMSTHVPTLVKVLSRIDPKKRADTIAELMCGRLKVKLTAGETELFVPRVAEQLEFPDTKKVEPEQHVGARRVFPFGVDPSLLGKALRAVAHVTHGVEWSVPTNPEHPIRLDIIEAETGITGFFVVMPLRLSKREA
jgi:hypothetical protein